MELPVYATRNILEELTGIERRSAAMKKIAPVGFLLLGKNGQRVPIYLTNKEERAKRGWK
jgi:hypothetical protein